MKAVSIICTIGTKNISNKAIKDLSIDRKFSDTSDPFTMTIIDSPDVALLDLELYMNAGYRSITVSYTDSNSTSEYSRFKGQIWDYQCTFVGDIKQLEISGYLTRTSNISYSGQTTYNIDWNEYYYKRLDEKEPWNAINMQLYSRQNKYKRVAFENAAKAAEFANSDAVYSDDPNAFGLLDAQHFYNSFLINVTGPSGKSIPLGFPDVFTTMKLSEKNDKGEIIYEGDDIDWDRRFWGPLQLEDYGEAMIEVDGGYRLTWDTGLVYYRELPSTSKGEDIYDKKIRGFAWDDGPAYIQMDPSKDYYGGGQLLYNPSGVDPSYIVARLAQLEGWDIGNIVQTEYVPCSDKFKMQGKTAMEFINDVLVPCSITPAGLYTKEDGSTIEVTSGYSGFVAYFKNNKFYYEPLNYKSTRDLTNYTFGYNIPDSKVISFQVETKGTSFYTNPVQINGISLVTGQEQKEMVISNDALIQNYNKVRGHQETLDAFFGYTYEQTEEMFKDHLKNYSDAWNIWLLSTTKFAGGIKPSTDNTKGQSYWISARPFIKSAAAYMSPDLYSDYAFAYQSDIIQKGLVHNYNISSEDDSTVNTLINGAYDKIKKARFKANMVIWGDTNLNPNSCINITNMVKGSNNLPTKHASSGTYLIYQQKDVISDGQFTQQLSLLRCDNIGDYINKERINWSTSVQEVKYTTASLDDFSEVNKPGQRISGLDFANYAQTHDY